MVVMQQSLAQARRLRGHTVRSLAEAAGLAVSCIADIERGATRRPRPSTLVRIVGVLGVAPETIREFGNGDDGADETGEHTQQADE